MSETDDAINRLMSIPEPDLEASGAKVNCNCLECNALRACRKRAIDDCVKAVVDGFEASLDQYVLIGPSGMAMRMLNSIKAVGVSVLLAEQKARRNSTCPVPPTKAT